MANVPMTDATMLGVASSAEYNKVTANVRDLDARLGPVVSTLTAHARLTALEALTADTGTSPGGIGNQRLADRLGSGVGTTTNVTTGTATAQLTDLRSRASSLETRMTAAEGASSRRMEFGSVNLNAAAGGSASANITFPGAAFAAIPHLNLTPSNGRLNVSYSALTTTGFTLIVNNWTAASGGSVPVLWQAVAKS